MDWENNEALDEEDIGVQEVRNLFQQLLERDKRRHVASTEETKQEPEESPESFTAQPAIIDWTTLSHMPEDEDEEDAILAGAPLVFTPGEEEPDEPLALDEYDAQVQEEEEQILPPPPVVRQNPLRVLWMSFASNLPQKGDKGNDLIQKSAFLIALVMLFALVGYVLFNVALQPAVNDARYEDLAETYKSGQLNTTLSADYPARMLEAFCPLYNKNPEVRGWIKYTSTDTTGFLDIQYPIMYSGDNEKYVKHDFYENRNKNGALFFDKDASLETADSANKVLIVYGNNALSGQMFAGLNQLTNIRKAKAATTFTLNTLFESNRYKVFAVLLTDEKAVGDDYFDTGRTSFANNGEFMRYVQELRARSLFDYPVDIVAGDRLVVLSTGASHSNSNLSNGRLVVVARQVRISESSKMDAGPIRENKDVIMPRAWYDKNHAAPHAYYTDTGYTLGDETYTTTSTTTTTLPGGVLNVPAGGENTTQTKPADTDGSSTAGTGTTTTTGTGRSSTVATTTVPSISAAGDNVVGADS